MTPPAQAFAAESLLVVAHPDDEALWFSSVLAHVARLAICYLDENGLPPEFARARLRVQQAYPLSSAVWLGVCGAGMFGKGVWDGTHSPWGVRFADGVDVDAYRNAYRELEHKLANLVGTSQVKRIICHSPWGEYGHEDHVQVFVAAANVAAKFGLEVWFPLYCSQFTVAAANERVQDFASACVTLPTDVALAHRLRDLYANEECWTWPSDHEWLPSETFVRLSSDRKPWGAVQINYMRLPYRDVPARRGVVAIVGPES